AHSSRSALTPASTLSPAPLARPFPKPQTLNPKPQPHAPLHPAPCTPEPQTSKPTNHPAHPERPPPKKTRKS
ncbi:hypothetical protein T484DRAFT_3640447, partial [Baffinella frigidus]